MARTQAFSALNAPSGIGRSSGSAAPLGEINTTPLIDVLLVLLVMLILSVPAAVNQLPIDLPAPSAGPPPVLPGHNTVSLTPAGQAQWNGAAVTSSELFAALQATTRLRPEPELRFEPAPSVPYDSAARTLALIKASGVSAFGFVGNDRFTGFEKAAPKP